MRNGIDNLIYELQKDFNTSIHTGIEFEEYNFRYNKYFGNTVDITFKYNDGEMTGLGICIADGELPVPNTMLEEVTECCETFCEEYKESVETLEDREETNNSLIYNFD